MATSKIKYTSATRDNPMIAGVVYVSVTPLPSITKVTSEHSQSTERCGRFEKDLNVEGSGSSL